MAKELPEGMAIVALNPGVINTEMLASCFGNSASQYQLPESWYEFDLYIEKYLHGLTHSSRHTKMNNFFHFRCVCLRALKAATMILHLTAADNGASLTV